LKKLSRKEANIFNLLRDRNAVKQVESRTRDVIYNSTT